MEYQHKRNDCVAAMICERIELVNVTIDAGLAVRTGTVDLAPSQRLSALRTTLLGGRGPGASTEEVTAHTRDRPLLGAVPASVERALVARQGEHVRAGVPIVNPRVRRPGDTAGSWRSLAWGAVLALTVRAVAARLFGRSTSERQ